MYKDNQESKGKSKRSRKFYSDGNSCYRATFDRYNAAREVSNTEIGDTLYRESNGSIRDNLARFNRKTKRYTKSIEM
ncbi:hypothetical protein AGMMS49531_00670 [Endomicrobiia bacterium]|nr:hypothetical protein AGMMS49531_00670 [Endomicrobiia bacterium]